MKENIEPASDVTPENVLVPVTDTDATGEQKFKVEKTGMYRLMGKQFVELQQGVEYTWSQIMGLPRQVKLNRAERRTLEKKNRSKRKLK
jgi:hypothetical protein